MAKLEVKAYTINVANSLPTRHWISLFEHEDRGAHKANLYFQDNQGGDRVRIDSQNRIHATFEADCFAPAVDLLRNEKPVWLHYDAARNVCFLATTKEPVGEEETS